MKKYLKPIVLILWMGLIFYLSAQPAKNSTLQTNIVVDIIYKIYSNIFNDKVDFITFNSFLFKPVRKIAHFLEYTVLGMLAYINFKDLTKKNTIVISIVFSVLYAISDEIHQMFVPGRYCALLDMFIDACGATLGIILIHLIITRWRKN